MRETLALAGRHVRSAIRSRAPLVLASVLLAGLATTFLLPTGSDASAATLGALFLVGASAFAVAAGSGALLPSDRAEGREEWLAPHAPSGAERRLAAALAGALLALGTSLAGALLAGIVPRGGTAAYALSASEAVTLPAVRRFRDPSHGRETRPIVVRVGEALSDEPGRTLEVEARGILPRPAAGGLDKAPGRFEVAWSAGRTSGTASVPFHGRLLVPLPQDADEVAFEARTEGMDLRFVEAHVLGGGRPRFLTLLWAGLLLGLLAASMAPIAVLVSRATSGPTAAGAAAALVLLGLLRGPLEDLALYLGGGSLESAALGLLRAATLLAPDLSALGALGDPVSGRALGASALGAALPALAYGLVGLVLVALPMPRALVPQTGEAS